MPDERVTLETEQAQSIQAVRGAEDGHVALAVAAAIAFHQVHGSTKAIVTRQDYNGALDIAAAALSRLMPIYTRNGDKGERVTVAIDLAGERFARGATQLRHADGTAIAPLSIRLADMQPAIALMKRAGLRFSFSSPFSTASAREV